MARINTNVGAMVANTNLAKSQKALNTSLERLSSGMRINSGADDPAGLIASETLRSEIQGITTGIDNPRTRQQRDHHFADAAPWVKSPTCWYPSRGWWCRRPTPGALSPDEIQANQLQVDSAIASITRISNSTISLPGLNCSTVRSGYV